MVVPFCIRNVNPLSMEPQWQDPENESQFIRYCMDSYLYYYFSKQIEISSTETDVDAHEALQSVKSRVAYGGKHTG